MCPCPTWIILILSSYLHTRQILTAAWNLTRVSPTLTSMTMIPDQTQLRLNLHHQTRLRLLDPWIKKYLIQKVLTQLHSLESNTAQVHFSLNQGLVQHQVFRHRKEQPHLQRPLSQQKSLEFLKSLIYHKELRQGNLTGASPKLTIIESSIDMMTSFTEVLF